MKISDFKQAFFTNQKIENFLNVNNFIYKAKDFYCISDGVDATTFIDFRYNSYSSAGIALFCYIAVSNKKIYELINKNSGAMKINQGNCRINIAVIEDFYNRGEKAALLKIDDMKDRFPISSDQSLKDFIDRFIALFNDYGLNYIKTYSHIENIDKGLNEKPSADSIHQDGSMLYKALTGVTAAKLNNNPRMPKIVKEYSDYMSDASPIWQNAFNRQLEILNDS